MRNLRRLVWVILVSFLSIGALGSCKKKVTNKEIVEKYRGELEARKKDLKRFKKAIPATFDGTLEADLDPELKYSKAYRNAYLLPVEAIEDPTQVPETKPYLGYDGQLLGALRDLDLPPGQEASSTLDSQMSYAATPLDYVIVYRVAHYHPVVATDDTSFDGGKLTIEAYVLDWKKAKVRAQVLVQGEPDMSGSFKYKEGEDKQKALESVVEASLHKNTMEQLARELAKATHGKVVFDEHYGTPKEPAAAAEKEGDDDDDDEPKKKKKKKGDDDDDD
jgi:hypothetical protein